MHVTRGSRLATFVATILFASSAFLGTLALPDDVFASGLVCQSGSEQHYGQGADPITFTVYESASRLIGHPNGHHVCIHQGAYSVNIPNLKNVAYAYNSTYEDSVCLGQLATSYGTWNDCISSIEWNLPSCHYTFAVYADANYGGLIYSLTGPTNTWANFNGFNNDAASSIKLTYSSVCPTSPVR